MIFPFLFSQSILSAPSFGPFFCLTPITYNHQVPLSRRYLSILHFAVSSKTYDYFFPHSYSFFPFLPASFREACPPSCLVQLFNPRNFFPRISSPDRNLVRAKFRKTTSFPLAPFHLFFDCFETEFASGGFFLHHLERVPRTSQSTLFPPGISGK